MVWFSSHFETTVEDGMALTDRMLRVHYFKSKEKLRCYFAANACHSSDSKWTGFNITSMEFLKKHP